MDAFTDNSAIIVALAVALFFALGFGALLTLWIAAPFSIFGTKPLLKRLIEEQEKTNRLLSELYARDKASTHRDDGGNSAGG